MAFVNLDDVVGDQTVRFDRVYGEVGYISVSVHKERHRFSFTSERRRLTGRDSCRSECLSGSAP